MSDENDLGLEARDVEDALRLIKKMHAKCKKRGERTQGKVPMGSWTKKDALERIYGKDWVDSYDWEDGILDALSGLVPLDVAVRVLEFAHEAERDGARNALCD